METAFVSSSRYLVDREVSVRTDRSHELRRSETASGVLPGWRPNRESLVATRSDTQSAFRNPKMVMDYQEVNGEIAAISLATVATRRMNAIRNASGSSPTDKVRRLGMNKFGIGGDDPV